MMIIKGFRFGLLLQFALGPITLLIFQIAVTSGFPAALQGVAGVTVVDGLYVLAAILGMGTLLNRDERIKELFSVGGAVVMLLFGAVIILGSFGIELVPSLNITAGESSHAFIRAAVLTGANPMTILFWAGVFSTKMVEEGMTRRDMYAFGVGAVLTTPVAQTVVAIVGSTLKVFLNDAVMLVLNVAVGLVLIGFGIRMLLSHIRSEQPVIKSQDTYQTR